MRAEEGVGIFLAGARNLLMGRTVFDHMSPAELTVAYWNVLARVGECAGRAALGEVTMYTELQALHLTSGEIVRHLDAACPGEQPPRSRQMAEAATHRYQKELTELGRYFDFTGDDTRLVVSEAPTPRP